MTADDTNHLFRPGEIAGLLQRRTRIGALIALLFVSGCAVSPKVEDAPVPPAPDEGWAAPGAGEARGRPITQNWLDDLHSPILDALVAEALIYNNNLAQAVARRDGALASARVAGAARFPTLDAAANGSRSRLSTDIGFGPDTQGVSSLSWSLQASWEADVWGRIRDATRAAKADAAAFEQDLSNARLSIAGSVATAWFTLIEAHQQTLLAQSDVENRERNLRLISRRFASGLSRSLDLRLARSDLATVRAGLEAAIQTEREAARGLEVLLGRYPKASLDYPDTLPELPTLDGAGIPAQILVRRPDLQSAEARLLAAGLRVREARKALLPRLTFTGNLGPESSTLGDLFDAEEIAGNIIGGLVQPLFQGGRLRANIDLTRARAEESLYFYVDTVLNAYREVENALDAEALLARQEAERARAAEEARASQALAERDYRAGIVTIFDFLESNARRIANESALLLVRRIRLTNRIALYVALAAPFEPDTPAPLRTVPYSSDATGRTISDDRTTGEDP